MTTKLGAHIPLIYHFAMLQDPQRMEGFREAINIAVKPGARVLELGGGSGVLSFFAAQKASKVYCVECVPENAKAARDLLDKNPNGEKVEVVCADAFDYLPPEPVDVVICEMLHVAMVRERQIEVIESFKRRYLEHFGGPLPRFVPEAFIQAIQPINYNFDFFGYNAAVPLFQDPSAQNACAEIGEPTVFQLAQYSDNLPVRIEWSGSILAKTAGLVNAVRFILKNVLAIHVEENRGVFWHNQHLVLPLREAFAVSPGDTLQLSFAYQTGCEIEELIQSIGVAKQSTYTSLTAQIERTSEARREGCPQLPVQPTSSGYTKIRPLT